MSSYNAGFEVSQRIDTEGCTWPRHLPLPNKGQEYVPCECEHEVETRRLRKSSERFLYWNAENDVVLLEPFNTLDGAIDGNMGDLWQNHRGSLDLEYEM